MAFRASCVPRTFTFRTPARTSRGTLREKISWFFKVWDEANPQVFGVGECSPLPRLSPDDRPELQSVLAECVRALTGMQHIAANHMAALVQKIVPAGYPAVAFAMETALRDLLHGGHRMIYDNAFLKDSPIPINGLVWMGDLDEMLQQVTHRINDGYTCIKMKVGGLNFEKECDILYYIRRKYFRDRITLRLDANGAFKPADALHKLHELARFDIHSIEQPVKPGCPEMAEICQKSPIPVALDEELIGVESANKKALLKALKPAYIILKPTLHGGLTGCEEWISLAQETGTGFWITSALESNIGLNAICQFTANYPVELPQGLGTGTLYEDNIPSPLESGKGVIRYKRGGEWNLDGI